MPLLIQTPAGTSRLLLDGASATVDLPDAGCPAWVQANSGGLGYYRVAYPAPLLTALMARADASGTWVLPWARPKLRADGPDRGVIRWAIIKPRPGAACALR